MRSFIKWVGGQRLLARTIADILPEHSCYVEPFGGAAWVLFTKEPSPVEVYNDLDARLANLFMCVKYHSQELARELEWLLPSRAVFEGFSQQPGLTDIQRAARFFCQIKLSYGGHCKSFSACHSSPSRFVLENLVVDMERARKRLEKTVIEHMDFADCLRRYDSAETCFFLSPPYLECTGYKVAFSLEDHERLRTALSGVTGQWLLLYSDHKWVRAAYSGFPVYSVDGWYTLHGGPPKRAPQLIVSNEPIPYGLRRRTSIAVRRVRVAAAARKTENRRVRTGPAAGRRGPRARARKDGTRRP